MEVLNETLAVKMGDPKEDPTARYDVDCSYGRYGVFVVVVFFQFVNWIIKSVGPPKALRDDEWKWRNLKISWLHALVCIVWITFGVVTEPQMMLDLQYYKSYTIMLLLSFTTGYFLYDFLDLALNGKMISMWEVQTHHVAIGSVFFYNLVQCEWIPFNIIALMVEINSFFLHWRKLLQMVGTPYHSKLYRTIKFLNITTFAVFRGLPLLAISYAMTQWYQRVSLAYYLCLCFSMFVMVTMNPILFMRLLRSDYLRPRGSREGGRGKEGGDVVDKVMSGNNNNYSESSSSNGVAAGGHLKSS